MCATCLSHHILLEFIILIISGEEILKFSFSSCYFLPLKSKYFPQHSVFKYRARSPHRQYVECGLLGCDAVWSPALRGNVPPPSPIHLTKSWGNKLYEAEFSKLTRTVICRKTRNWTEQGSEPLLFSYCSVQEEGRQRFLKPW
jgi:hypothetical protein